MSWLNSAFDDFKIPNAASSSTTNRIRGIKRPSSTHKESPSTNEKFNRIKRPSSQDSGKLWVDSLQPKSRLSLGLAIHSKKVKEVEDWIDIILNGSKCKILLLTGPTGCGKTASVSVLCREKKVTLQEWINPLPIISDAEFNNVEGKKDTADYINNLYQSQKDLFADFLLNASRYKCLQFEGDTLPNSGNKILLVEDLPNVFFRRPEEFHLILRKYNERAVHPVIFIVSDSRCKECNPYYLFPKALLLELCIQNISFNPIAPTFMVRALEEVLQSYQHQITDRVVRKDILQKLADSSGGDLRSAINALQFANSKAANMKRVFSATKSSSSNKKDSSDSTLSLIGGKDYPLFMFHALGKILHCKRQTDVSIPHEERLPTHLCHEERHPLTFVPEEVQEKSHMTSTTLQAFLHQNYLNFFSKIEDVERASQYLCDADCMIGDWVGKEVLEPYASSVAVRGLVHSNTGVVRAWRPIQKPQWFDIMTKRRKRMQQSRDLFSEYLWATNDQLTDLIPYLATLPSAKLTGERRRFVQEVGRMNFGTKRIPTVHHADQLSEKECLDDADDDIPNVSSSKLEDKVIDLDQGEEEDFIIEEFED